MTQLYSNLVNYLNSTTYLCLVLAVLCSLVVPRVRLASLHTISMDPPKPFLISSVALLPLCSLVSIPLLILITENKEGPKHGFKTKEFICLTEV